MKNQSWLTARPIAHRGLHDLSRGIVENTPAAVSAAAAANYGIEIDVQVSADGEAMVQHDDRLGRLVEGDEDVRTLGVAALKARPFRAGTDRMATLGEICDLVNGRVPLLVELKSRFDGDLSLPRRVAKVLAAYSGPVAVMSFDPAPIVALRRLAPHLPHGITAERRFAPGPDEVGPSGGWPRLRLDLLLHAPSSRPGFLAYRLQDLATAPPRVARALGLPVLTWTVRSPADRTAALARADQVIFEGFLPEP
ncbi:Glycerophosphoryl diester phosphodiesterase [Rhodovulum sp. PH10]|uniref:glycerophosphodiester phosphodiesterase family protein n=1 Tax=Rhodovulum sp. PH10 TaxID=1187851 RepID=UPI00027C2CBC|nr:glycerophosphodiester phosphodiesterase family protein [Rhodovulum sp. PH10]EJW12075.1 Glycerophosphoryl diester phosphodiesterase [Rhodovulum sp. PH10]